MCHNPARDPPPPVGHTARYPFKPLLPHKEYVRTLNPTVDEVQLRPLEKYCNHILYLSKKKNHFFFRTESPFLWFLKAISEYLKHLFSYHLIWCTGKKGQERDRCEWGVGWGSPAVCLSMACKGSIRQRRPLRHHLSQEKVFISQPTTILAFRILG